MRYSKLIAIKKNSNAAFLLAIGIVLLFQIGLSCSKTHKRNVTLSCKELLSSCGECEECRILEVKGDSVLNENLKGQMLKYEFENSKTQDEFDRESPFCLICCTYIFSGDLVITGETQRLNVAKFEILVDSSCCTINSPCF